MAHRTRPLLSSSSLSPAGTPNSRTGGGIQTQKARRMSTTSLQGTHSEKAAERVKGLRWGSVRNLDGYRGGPFTIWMGIEGVRTRFGWV
eukprot:186974-Prorocentrum_minimum.AAC.1